MTAQENQNIFCFWEWQWGEAKIKNTEKLQNQFFFYEGGHFFGNSRTNSISIQIKKIKTI